MDHPDQIAQATSKGGTEPSRNLDALFRKASDSDYEGEQWLATFAVYLLTEE